MKRWAAAVTVAVMFTCSQAEAQTVKDVFLVKASRCSGQAPDRERVQTGYVAESTPGVFTALHGVHQCASITATVVGDKNTAIDMMVTRVDVSRDVALLAPITPTKLPSGLPVAKGGKATSDALVAVGHPLNLSQRQLRTRAHLRSRSTVPLTYLIPSDEQNLFGIRKSPELDIMVWDVEGALTVGHSGAPILDKAGHVLGMVNGGLRAGAVEISWGIPQQDIALSNNEPSQFIDRDLSSTSKLLFSLEVPTDRPARSFSCFGEPFSLIRVVTADELIASVDDELTYRQLIHALNADVQRVLLNLYRDGKGTTTLVVPAGFDQVPGDDENCRFRLLSANVPPVELNFHRHTLEASPGQLNAQLQRYTFDWEYEQFCQSGFVVNPSMSNTTARPNIRRGLITRRKSFVWLDHRCAPFPNVARPDDVAQQWSTLARPALQPKGVMQCGVPWCAPTVLGPMATYPEAWSVVGVFPASSPAIVERFAFLSLVGTARAVLFSHARVDSAVVQDLEGCTLELNSSARCRELYEHQASWAAGALAVTAATMTPEW